MSEGGTETNCNCYGTPFNKLLLSRMSGADRYAWYATFASDFDFDSKPAGAGLKVAGNWLLNSTINEYSMNNSYVFVAKANKDNKTAYFLNGVPNTGVKTYNVPANWNVTSYEKLSNPGILIPFTSGNLSLEDGKDNAYMLHSDNTSTTSSTSTISSSSLSSRSDDCLI